MQKDLGYYDELRSGVGSSMFRVCKFIMTEKIVCLEIEEETVILY